MSINWPSSRDRRGLLCKDRTDHRARACTLWHRREVATYDNQKFIFDVRAKVLVAHFSYPPFQVSQVLQGPQGPQFVMSDTQQLLLVETDAGEPKPPSCAEGAGSSHAVTYSHGGVFCSGDRVYRTPVLRPSDASRFSVREKVQVGNEQNRDGLESRLWWRRRFAKESKYRLPQSELRTWQQARKDDIENGIPADQPEISEEIGPHQLEGNRLWFGKTFYNGEGRTGVGGFGYFDATTRSYRLYSPPEIHRWSVSAIRVSPRSSGSDSIIVENTGAIQAVFYAGIARRKKCDDSMSDSFIGQISATTMSST